MTRLKDIGFIRRLTCLHEFEYLDEAKYYHNGASRPYKWVTFYRCKKCSKIQKIRM